MKVIAIKILCVFVTLFACQTVFGQKSVQENKAQLIDSFEWLGGDDGAARLNSLMIEIQGEPHSLGYIIIYCGKSCFFGEIDAHIHGVEQELAFAGYDRQKFVIISGGFREVQTTEFWLVKENDCPPKPKPTIDRKEVKLKKSKKRIYRPYWCC